MNSKFLASSACLLLLTNVRAEDFPNPAEAVTLIDGATTPYTVQVIAPDYAFTND